MPKMLARPTSPVKSRNDFKWSNAILGISETLLKMPGKLGQVCSCGPTWKVAHPSFLDSPNHANASQAIVAFTFKTP